MCRLTDTLRHARLPLSLASGRLLLSHALHNPFCAFGNVISGCCVEANVAVPDAVYPRGVIKHREDDATARNANAENADDAVNAFCKAESKRHCQ